MRTIGIIVTAVYFALLAILLNGWALLMLWGWFMVPKFQIPSLTSPEAIGLGMIATFLSDHTDPNTAMSDDISEEKLIKSLLRISFRPLIAVAFGWMVQSFI